MVWFPSKRDILLAAIFSEVLSKFEVAGEKVFATPQENEKNKWERKVLSQSRNFSHDTTDSCTADACNQLFTPPASRGRQYRTSSQETIHLHGQSFPRDFYAQNLFKNIWKKSTTNQIIKHEHLAKTHRYRPGTGCVLLPLKTLLITVSPYKHRQLTNEKQSPHRNFRHHIQNWLQQNFHRYRITRKNGLASLDKMSSRPSFMATPVVLIVRRLIILSSCGHSRTSRCGSGRSGSTNHMK